MDELDRKIRESLREKEIPEEYNKMIENTMQMIKDGKISRENPSNVIQFKQKKKNRFFKFSQAAAAVMVIGVLGVTTYAGVTRKIRF